MAETIYACKRCGARCKIDPIPGSKSTMLRRAAGPGLCINCAAHDWLRNTYPMNLLLARSGPRSLALPQIQQQFAGLMKMAHSDARPDEINWQKIIDNWALPFPDKVRRRAQNPAGQEELDREPQRYQRQLEFEKQQIEDPHKHERDMDQAVRGFLKAVGSTNADKPMAIKEDLGNLRIYVDNDNARE